MYGKSEHTLDSKGRLFIPTRFDRELGESFVVSGNGCLDGDGVERRYLSIFPLNVWEELQEHLAESEIPEEQEMAELLFALGNDCQRDSSGRIVLTAEQREYAGLQKNVVVVGNNRIANIWDANLWAEHQQTQLHPARLGKVITKGITKRRPAEGASNA